MTARVSALLRRSSSPALVLGLAAFALYVRTAARTVVLGDGPELAAAAHQLGVCHPTGYPLYMIVCHLAIRLLPIGEAIFRTTLVSAAFGAVTVGLLYMVTLSISRQRWVSVFVAAFFAVTDTFWSQSVITEVYTMHLALLLSALWFTLRWEQTGNQRYVAFAALTVGLGLAHHLMTVLWIPALLVMCAASLRCRPVHWTVLRLVPLALLPLTLYAYLPIAAMRDPVINWGDPRTLRNFVAHVTGEQYRFKMGKLGWRGIRNRFVNYAWPPEEHKRDGYLLSQFGPAIVWLAPVGILELARRRRRVLWATLLAYAFPVAWGALYDIPDADAYYLPSHLVVAIWIGLGLSLSVRLGRVVLRRLRFRPASRRRLHRLVANVCLVVPALVGAANFDLNDQSRDRSARGVGPALLQKLDRDAVLYISGDAMAFGALYAQQVLGVRPDVVLLVESYFQRDTFRLILRERRRGLKVTEPECSRKAPKHGEDKHFWCRVAQVVKDNLPSRPFYAAGPCVGRFDKSSVMKSNLPPYRFLVPGLELIRFGSSAGPPHVHKVPEHGVHTHR